VTTPCSVKESEADEKSIDVSLPRAGLGGQAPAWFGQCLVVVALRSTYDL
jgi:hypothetical protein